MNGYSKILLAEDNAQDVELTLEALREINLANEVAVVEDGVEALEYLRRQGKWAGRAPGHPAVVLLDLKMPRKDGMDVLRELKADPALRSVPVVMMTSSKEERDVVESYRLGVNAYVVKPVDFQQFLKSVRQVGLFWALINQTPPEAGR